MILFTRMAVIDAVSPELIVLLRFIRTYSPEPTRRIPLSVSVFVPICRFHTQYWKFDQCSHNQVHLSENVLSYSNTLISVHAGRTGNVARNMVPNKKKVTYLAPINYFSRGLIHLIMQLVSGMRHWASNKDCWGDWIVWYITCYFDANFLHVSHYILHYQALDILHV